MTIGLPCSRSFIHVLGVQTAFYRKGKGPTVVLVHGASPGACSELNWYKNFDYLVSRGYEVIAFDQAGFGHSGAPDDPSLEFRFRHAEAFLTALGLTSAVIVGNSMGGLIAVLLHQSLKESSIKVNGLVLLAQFPHFEMSAESRTEAERHRDKLAAIKPNADSVRRLTLGTFFNRSLVTDDIVMLRTSMLAKNWQAYEMRQQGNAGLGIDLKGVRAEPISTPTLIIWGRDDKSLPSRLGVEALTHFLDAQLLLLPRCGHWPQTEQTNAVHSAMICFIDGLYEYASAKPSPQPAYAESRA